MSGDVRRLVGRNLKALRRAAGITQAELAVRMDVDRAYVSGLEQGVRNPTVETLWLVSKCLDVPIKAFFEEKSRGRTGR